MAQTVIPFVIHFQSRSPLRVKEVDENNDTRDQLFKTRDAVEATDTKLVSKSLVTPSPAVKWCRLSPRHSHASRLYDHIHSHDLSYPIKPDMNSARPTSCAQKCCCPGSLRALLIIDEGCFVRQVDSLLD